ncbi:DUF6795 domain-containing protein [Pseudoalteromonas sp. DL-6]|uniref:DUF6795 domain-containing protein n=1 Tax=Pseudoalteromonas sp. DL-6 TaxID=1390185 RepID=UPI00103D0A66|nr:DUF6795 domain-containing protein [Pseudoalteromonas sp. DL-6]QBJ62448.1 hypothetical protein B1F84_05010 [Pseudoalteromonas sp. DL-6]
MNKSSYSPRFIILLILVCVIIFPAISQGEDMFSWFKKKKEVFLSPEVNGIVTKNGTPVANLEIIRSLIYIDEKVHRDTVSTDQNGRFHFSKKKILSSIPNKLIVENRVSQEIFIENNDALIPLWIATQSGIDEVPEYSKKLSLLNCEITNPHVVFEFRNQKNIHRNYVAQSICRWEEDFLPYKLLKDGKEYQINNYDLTDLTER